MSPILQCQSLHKSYLLGRNVLPVLRGIDLSIQHGKFVIIIGSSGSGKSTLLHVLSGLDVPQRGQVHYKGEPLFEPEGLRTIPLGRDSNHTSADTELLRTALTSKSTSRPGIEDRLSHRWVEQRRNDLLNSAFGFVFQFYHLLPEFDVLENVLLPAMVGRPIAGWLASRTDIAARALTLLDQVGLKNRLHHRPNELSGGERQRVAICRALMNNPAVLFADEPTGNLDARTGREIFGLLKDLNKSGQTLVMVTHDRDLADQADQVVQLVDGKVQ
jgi:lipoprotein-releasing system ATP-binding protein